MPEHELIWLGISETLNSSKHNMNPGVQDGTERHLLQELVDGAALLHGDAAAVAGAVPVGEGDVDRLLLDPPLVLLPLLPQVLPQLVLLLVLHKS